jgi:DNA-binding YbaB/EbfC family protein
MAGFDFGSMMEMAQNVQQQAVEAQQQLAATELIGSAGGGVVSVTLNGHLHLVALHINPSAVDPEDPSMLEDLIAAAWQDAYDQVAQLQASIDPMAGLGGLGDIGDLFGGV